VLLALLLERGVLSVFACISVVRLICAKADGWVKMTALHLLKPADKPAGCLSPGGRRFQRNWPFGHSL